MELLLDPQGIGVADANGVIAFIFAPSQMGERFDLTNISVSNNGAANCKAAVYRNNISPSMRFTGTLYANEDNDSGPFPYFRVGERIVIEFTGCTPGSQCIANITGKRILPDSNSGGFHAF